MVEMSLESGISPFMTALFLFNVRYHTEDIRYPLVVHYWEDWHDENYDADFPRLVLQDHFLEGANTLRFRKGAHARTQQIIL